jgi:hypothetical protein
MDYTDSDRERFERIFRTNHLTVHAFARRRVAAEAVDDVVSRHSLRHRKTLVTSRFTVYKVLSGAAASTSLLSIRHAHPTARIVVGERAFYAAEIRLGAS